MLIKRGAQGVFLGLVLLFIGALFLLLTVAQDANAVTGRECGSTGYTQSMCGGSITTQGYGAVELCQVCKVCGAQDGVCPESYSDGRNETQADKITVAMRTVRATFDGSGYTVAFKTGSLACASIGGTCSFVQKLVGSSWQSASCGLDVSIGNSNNATFKANCINVPRTPGCENCPDPNCGTNVSGMTLDATTKQPIGGVDISITSNGNSNIYTQALSSSIGQYENSTVTGNLIITCSKSGFQTKTVTARLFPGRNIVDCLMQNVSDNVVCNSDCTQTINGVPQNTCVAACNGTNGCSFFDTTTMNVCDGKSKNTPQVIDPSCYALNCTYELVPKVQCCIGAPYNETTSCNGLCTGQCAGSGCEAPNCNPNDANYTCCMNNIAQDNPYYACCIANPQLPLDSPECACQVSDPLNYGCCLDPTPTYLCCVNSSNPMCNTPNPCDYDPNKACCLQHNVTYFCCVNPTNPSCIPYPAPPGNYSLYSSNVSSVITRTYRKEMYGIPVTLKIIVYEK